MKVKAKLTISFREKDFIMTMVQNMKYIQEIVIAPLAPNTSTLQAIAFTMTGKKSDGHRYYLALQTQATIKTPQN